MSVTDPDEIAEAVRRSTARSGVPERLEDPAVAARVAELLRPTEQRRAS